MIANLLDWIKDTAEDQIAERKQTLSRLTALVDLVLDYHRGDTAREQKGNRYDVIATLFHEELEKPSALATLCARAEVLLFSASVKGTFVTENYYEEGGENDENT